MHRSLINVQDAILKLESNLTACVPYCCFGNDNKKKIVAMIDVLKHSRSKVWINSTFLTPSELLHEQPDNVMWQSAIDAREWLDGKFDIEELLFKEMVLTANALMKQQLNQFL